MQTAGDTPDPKIVPWTQVWVNPRFAIRRIFTQSGENGVHRLMMLRGMCTLAALRMPYWVQNRPEAIEVMILVFLVGPIAGLFFTYAYSGILGPLVRRSTGLNIPNSHLRIGIAWSFLPVIVGTLLFLLLCWLLYPEVLPLPKPPFDYYSVGIGAAIMSAGFVWTFLIRTLMTAEVTRMSAGKSFLFNFISLVCTDLPIVGVFLLYYTILGRVIDLT